MDRIGLVKKLGAEFMGTFALVFVGCGSIVSDSVSGGQVGHVGVSLCFGLVILVMVCATGHISGAHFNPAVTIAFAIDGRFPWREVLPYILIQCVAATSASALLALSFGTESGLGSTGSELSAIQAIVVEVALATLLMFVIAAVATDARAHGQMAGVAIGGTVAAASLFGGPLTGASMNPARSIGPALVNSDFLQLWIYIVAPIIGAVLGVVIYGLVRCEEDGGDLDVTGCC